MKRDSVSAYEDMRRDTPSPLYAARAGKESSRLTARIVSLDNTCLYLLWYIFIVRIYKITEDIAQYNFCLILI